MAASLMLAFVTPGRALHMMAAASRNWSQAVRSRIARLCVAVSVTALPVADAGAAAPAAGPPRPQHWRLRIAFTKDTVGDEACGIEPAEIFWLLKAAGWRPQEAVGEVVLRLEGVWNARGEAEARVHELVERLLELRVEAPSGGVNSRLRLPLDLDLSGNNLGDASAAELARLLNAWCWDYQFSTAGLALRGCGLTEAGARGLVQGTASYAGAEFFLDLRDNDAVEAADPEALFAALEASWGAPPRRPECLRSWLDGVRDKGRRPLEHVREEAWLGASAAVATGVWRLLFNE